MLTSYPSRNTRHAVYFSCEAYSEITRLKQTHSSRNEHGSCEERDTNILNAVPSLSTGAGADQLISLPQKGAIHVGCLRAV